MKTLRAGGHYAPLDKHYDRDKLRRIDEEQGRIRLNAEEVEGMIYLAVASMMAGSASVMLERFARTTGTLRFLRMLATMMHSAVKRLSDRVQCEQLITIANNCNGAEVSLTAHPKTGSMNIQYQHMQALVNQALVTCELTCTKTREESKTCPVRRALENVPGMKGAARERARLDCTSCPYMGLEMEEDE